MDPHLASTDGNCPGNVGSATLKSRSGQFSSVASCCLESCLQQAVTGGGAGGHLYGLSCCGPLSVILRFLWPSDNAAVFPAHS